MAKKKKSNVKKVVGKKGKKTALKKVKKKTAGPAKKKAVKKPAPRKRAPRRVPMLELSAGPAVVAAETLTVVVVWPSDLGQLNDLRGRT